MKPNSVICKFCNLNIGIKGFCGHLKSKHNIEFISYIKENLDDFRQFGWQLCDQCGLNLSRKTIKRLTYSTCSKECNKKMQSKTRKGFKRALGYKWTEKQRKENSIRQTGKHVGDLNVAKRLDVREKISSSMKHRAQQSDYINPMQGKTHTQESLRKIFEKRSMTKPEKIIADLLTNKNIEFTPQFFIVDGDNTYSYDFKLKNRPVLIEVDGDYWHGGPGVKKYWFGVEDTKLTDSLKDKVAISHGYTVIRLWESEIKNNLDECLTRILS